MSGLGRGRRKSANWQLADALLYCTYGSVRGALSNGRPYRDNALQWGRRDVQPLLCLPFSDTQAIVAPRSDRPSRCRGPAINAVALHQTEPPRPFRALDHLEGRPEAGSETAQAGDASTNRLPLDPHEAAQASPDPRVQRL